MTNFRRGEEVLITTYSPPEKAKVLDCYEVPFQQVPMTDPEMIKKYKKKRTFPLTRESFYGKILTN